MIKTATIFHHTRRPPCNLVDVLIMRGYEMDRIVTPTFDFEDYDPLETDLLYIAGGPIGVYEKSQFFFLESEIEIIQKRVAAGRPTIGVCLGAQLIAGALGAENFVGKNGSEAGWYDLQMTKAAESHPVRHFSPQQTHVFQWHGDTFTLPKGAILLASSEQYENQIFEYEDVTLGLQCHIEVNNEVLKEWEVPLIHYFKSKNKPMSLEQFREARRKNGPILEAQTTLFFNEWLDKIETYL